MASFKSIAIHPVDPRLCGANLHDGRVHSLIPGRPPPVRGKLGDDDKLLG